MLNRVVNDHLKKKKKKKTVKVFADNYDHCQSLDKLHALNMDKNEEIKRFIYEKGELHAENEELKQMISNPTLREHQLYLKISNL